MKHHSLRRVFGALGATAALSITSLAVAPSFAAASPARASADGGGGTAATPTVHTVTSIADYADTPPSSGWYAGDSRTTVGDQVSLTGSPSDPTHVDGSLALATPTGGDKANVQLAAPAGTLLSSLTQMSYQVRRDPASTNPIPTGEGSLQLGFSCDGVAGQKGFNGYLVFEPVYQNYAPRNGDNTVTPGAWQTWDAYDGGNAIWWSSWNIPKDPATSHLKPFKGPGADPAEYYVAFRDYVPLSAFEAACPAATVQTYALNQGSGQAGLTSYVDNVRINDDVWDFAVAGSPTLTIDAPTQLTAGADPTSFTGTVSVPDDGPQVPNGRVDFGLSATTTIGALDPSDVTLDYQGPDGSWVPVALTSNGSGGLTGSLPTPTGAPTPYEPGSTASTTFRVSLADGVKGGQLTWAAALNSVNADGDVVAKLATTDGTISVAGPAMCPASPGPSAVVRLDYLRLLDRCPDASGDAFWTTYLNSHSPTELALQLARSHERMVNLIDHTYGAVLDTTPSAAATEAWVEFLRHGGRFDDMVAFLAAISPTVRSYDGSDAQSLVEAIYHMVLSRDGDAGGVTYWTDQVNSGVSPIGLVLALAHSHEFAARVVDGGDPSRYPNTPAVLPAFGPGIYEEVLHRAGDTGGTAYWTTYFETTGRTFRMEGLFGGSSELTSQAQSFPAS